MPARAAQQNQANQVYGTQAQTASTNAQSDLSQATQDQTNLRSGKQVGANPYLNPTYLSAVNQLRSSTLNQQNNAADAQERANDVRTGGMNSTATTGAISKLAGDKMRLGNQLGAEQTAGDWTKNIGYQLNLAQQPIALANAQTGLYSTAQRGQSDALNNITQEDLAQMQLEAAAIQAAGGAAGGAAKGCWIAAAVFDGWNDPRTSLVRNWLHADYAKQGIGGVVVRLYMQYGERVANVLHRFPLLKTPFRWLFNRALRKAMEVQQCTIT